MGSVDMAVETAVVVAVLLLYGGGLSTYRGVCALERAGEVVVEPVT